MEIFEMVEKRNAMFEEWAGIVDEGKRSGKWTDKMEARIKSLDNETKLLQRLIDDKEEENRHRESLRLRADEKARKKERGKTIFTDMVRAAMLGETQRSFTVTSGSATIQDPLIGTEYTYALQDNNPLAALGARFETAGDNYLQIPKTTGEPTVLWLAEDATATVDSSFTMGSTKKSFSTAAINMELTQQAIDWSNDRIVNAIDNQIRQTLTNEIISVALHGNSANNQPDGLDNYTGVLTRSNSSLTITTYDPYIDCVGDLLAKKVPLERVGFIEGSTSWVQRNSSSGTDDHSLQASQDIEDMIRNRGHHSSAVLETFDTNTTTRIYFGDFSQMMVTFGKSMNGSGPIFKVDVHRTDKLNWHMIFWMYLDVSLLRPDNFLRLEDVALATIT